MQQLAAFRPLVTACAAAVGASLIALTPSVSNDVAAGLQRSAVDIQHRAVELVDAVNPIQTWIDLFQMTGSYLQTDLQMFQELPFLVGQQAAANWIEYASTYVGAYQSAAQGAVTFFTTGGNTTPGGLGTFIPALYGAFSGLAAGDVADFFPYLVTAFWTGPMYEIFQQLENTLWIPLWLSQNLTNALTYLIKPGFSTPVAAIITLGTWVVFEPGEFAQTFGVPLQAAYDAAQSGDLVGAITNLLNATPTALSQLSTAALQPGVTGNLVGIGGQYANFLSGGIATVPNAQNILHGGSLGVGLSSFLQQLVGAWPNPSIAVDQFVNTLTQYLGMSGLTSAADVVNGGSALTSLSADLPGLAAALPSVAANLSGLAPSIAANLSGLAPSIAADLAGRLPAELGTLAANILTSLF